MTWSCETPRRTMGPARIIRRMGSERDDPGPVVLRPVEVIDLDALRALEAAYAARTGVATSIDRAGLHHVARSGHAFVATRAAEVCGMVLAHAIWDGSRPVVSATRLVAAGDDPWVLARLLEALVKSAYDAAVYDVVVDLPETDAAGRAAVEAGGFAEQPLRRYGRVLGSRAAGPA